MRNVRVNTHSKSCQHLPKADQSSKVGISIGANKSAVSVTNANPIVTPWLPIDPKYFQSWKINIVPPKLLQLEQDLPPNPPHIQSTHLEKVFLAKSKLHNFE